MEALKSYPLVGLEISHEELKAIVNEKDEK